MNKIQTKPIPRFKRWSRKNYAVFASLRRYVTIGVLSVGMSILLLTTSRVRAAEVDSLTISTQVKIDEIGIVGSKAAPTRSTMSQTALYNREASAAAPVTTLETALRLSPSIDVRERSGQGVQADISIRGGSFDQTMVLLNGINFTDARTGHQTHSLPVDMDCIAGIDLIDGLTGVGAFAGAVNIRTQPLKPRYLRLEAQGGGDGYAYANLSGAVAKGGFTTFAAASFRRSDGDVHNTGFTNYNGYVRMNYESRRAGFFDLQGGYQNRSFGANGFYSLKYPDQQEQTSTGLASLRWVKSWEAFTLNASVSYRKNFDRFELVKNNPEKVPFNYHQTDNVGSELWGDYRSIAGVTSLGGDYAYNHIWSTVLGDKVDDPKGRYNHAGSRHVGNLWLRQVKSFRQFDVAGSIGVAFTPFGQSVLWSLSGGYRPLPGLKLEIGAAQSMRLPTFNDLYYTAKGYKGNPDLVPEQAVTYRLSADYTRGKWAAAFRTYYRDGKDIIDWVRLSADADWESQQLTSLGTFGVEFSGGYRTEKGFLRALTLSYGYISTSRKSGDYISKYALDYMHNKAALSAEVGFLRHFSVVLTGSVYDRNGKYNNREGALLSYKPYFLLDGRVAWTKGMWKLYFDATNLTGADYFDFGGLPMPGTWLGGGVVITIG
ncbi:MAG: TonB-dependent receptor [Alistipes sp.]